MYAHTFSLHSTQGVAVCIPKEPSLNSCISTIADHACASMHTYVHDQDNIASSFSNKSFFLNKSQQSNKSANSSPSHEKDTLQLSDCIIQED